MKKFLALLLLFSTIVNAQKKARVLRVIDGDTFVAVLLKNKDTVNIRVRYIDAPEGKNGAISKEQMGYRMAKDTATKMLQGKLIKLYYVNAMSYNRQVARVKVDGYYFDRAMTYQGFAWSLIQGKNNLHLRLQKSARKAKRGIFNPDLYSTTDSIKMLISPMDWKIKYSTRKK